jgi:uncharacterized LabA/DUF88 family protein
VSKNVAVFVDVANIFYAAKAAGVDIDYVTLLKSATAGRDFVRAYAYTGLDPENENQRQFHSFLARSGYKVVSKDIRKYGDGRIKANLDIELVVDMMRMAQHIDIAVVVSGDGDFAPAIRAVQQMGVRAEVISFRGNTSSDLIDVADVFTDITQIARVEKGARSGRRVAAEGDLSMTEVPDKETEGGTRRRRTRRGERPDERAERPEVAERLPVEVGLPGNLIVLPGERLSRVGTDGEHEDEPEGLEVEAADERPEGAPGIQGADAGEDADGRRRRRRRGGRGRGRGRQDGEAVGVGTAPAGIAPGEPVIDDEEFLDEEIAPLPQHSTFGSVWDSQLGVAPAPLAAAGAGPASVPDDEDFDDEPEIPEYLLAERRQQQRGRGRPMRPGQGGGGRRAGYQSAMDRERYGRPAGSTGGGSGYASSGGAPRLDRSRPPMGVNRNNRPPQQQQQPQQPRPSRPAYQEVQREPERSVSSAEPWSEVPADVQELLRAELARRQGSSAFQAPSRGSASPVGPAGGASSEAGAAPTAGATRSGRPSRRSTSSAPAGSTAETAPASASSASTEEAAPAAPARRGGRRVAASTTTTASDAGAGDEAVPSATEAPAPRARRTRATSAAAEPLTATSSDEAAPKPRRASTARSSSARGAASAGSSAGEGAADPAEASATPAAAPARRRTTRKAAEPAPGEA